MANPPNPGSRRDLRQRRRQLSAAQQRRASAQLARVLRQRLEFRRARRIAFYLASDGEIDPAPLLAFAHTAGKACYLPVLHPLGANRLHFVRYRPGQRLASNKFGIAEPRLQTAADTPAWALDIIFLPLVGFDRQGHRLGMGGGFYDRTLAFKRHRRASTPLLIGLAHSLQELGTITAAPWDVPLDAIATEREYICQRRGPKPAHPALE